MLRQITDQGKRHSYFKTSQILSWFVAYVQSSDRRKLSGHRVVIELASRVPAACLNTLKTSRDSLDLIHIDVDTM